MNGAGQQGHETTMVETVRGPIDVLALGPTLMHEHVFTFDPDYQINYPQSWGDRNQRVAEAADRLEQLYETGVRTIVDLTVLGLGRNLPLILEVAARTRMNIVVATGIYTFDEVPRPFRMKGPGAPLGGPEPMVPLFVDEINGGIGATGVRPAILKCATGIRGVTPGVERVLRAVAQAHLITGLPISTHTVARLRHGVDQQRIFAEEGVDLNRVVIGHCGDSDDISYLRGIADNGSYLGLDQFGIGHLAPLGQRIDLVVELCRLGYSDRIVLSHDFACYADVLDDQSREKLNPGWGYTCVTEQVVPELLRRGVSTGEVDNMLTHNAARILGR
jgi:phosphotriesterase-related protein